MSASWWANKLGAATPASPSAQRPAPPTHYPTRPLPPADGPSAAPRQATSAQHHDNCPECYSGNYMAPRGSNTRPRCYDCGYPLQQAGSGITSHTEGAATPSRQVSTKNNFNPKTIIGRIGE